MRQTRGQPVEGRFDKYAHNHYLEKLLKDIFDIRTLNIRIIPVYSFTNTVRISKNNSAGTACDILSPSKTQETHISMGSQLPSFITDAHSLCCIFNEKYTFIFANAPYAFTV